MTLQTQLASQFRAFYFGGNYTGVNLKDTLTGITWQEATTKVDSLNTIAALVFHMNYYVAAALNVLRGNPLNASDKYSFDLPSIQSQEDWGRLLHSIKTDVDALVNLIEKMPESQLWETFADEKYGNWYRNLAGIIEHNHYHLGQIVVIKKMISHAKEREE